MYFELDDTERLTDLCEPQKMISRPALVQIENFASFYTIRNFSEKESKANENANRAIVEPIN